MVDYYLICIVTTFLLRAAAVNYYSGKQFEQTAHDQYNFLRFTGGFGPYVDAIGHGISRETPDNCQVDQVFLLMRHGERYTDEWDGRLRTASLEKLDAYISKNQILSGDLAFYPTWDNFLKSEKNWWAQETFSGPYSGLSNAYLRGQEFRARYGHLWDRETPVPIFTAGFERVISTARKFGEGFFSYNYTDSVYLNILPESAASGANSLVPVCGGDYGKKESQCDKFTGIMPLMQLAADRLNEQNPGLGLDARDVFILMGIAPYELNVRPSTPWYEVFTPDEWVSFAYGSGDLFYYYCEGPGHKASKPLGSLYVNATLSVMTDTSEKSNQLYFSFVHGENLVNVLTAMDLYEVDQPPDMSNVQFLRTSATNFAVMGSNIVYERLKCNSTSINDAGHYVRVILNNAVVPIKNCSMGPGYSCPLKEYSDYINKRIIPFTKKCKVPKGAPEYLDFFWNYNKTNEFNYQKGFIQEGERQTNT